MSRSRQRNFWAQVGAGSRASGPTLRSYVRRKLASSIRQRILLIAGPQQSILLGVVIIVSPFTAKKLGRLTTGAVLAGAFSIFQVLFASFTTDSEANWASRFSLAVSEEFNDNIFFSSRKDSDFITSITPTLSLLYAPPGQTTPVFTASLSPEGQIYARESHQSNFGENTTFKTGYTYYHSPRLTFFAGDALRLRSDTRTGEFGGAGRPAPTQLPPPGSAVEQPASRRLGDFVSNGRELSNEFELRGLYSYNPNITVIGHYGLGFTRFLDQGGSEISNRVGVRGSYKWREEHNLNLGYEIEFVKSRDGKLNVIHNIDFGNDFLSTFKLRLTPTLTVTATSGVAVNTGGDGPSIANRSNLTVTKLWERATLNVGVNKGLTPSFGVSGISDTTSFFGNVTTRLTEQFSANANVEYSLFDTKDENIKTLLASAGVEYRINHWLSSNLRYSYRWEDGGSAATSTAGLRPGKITSNVVMLTFVANFDLWPRFGLGQPTSVP